MARATGSINYLEHRTPFKDESGKYQIHPMFVKRDIVDQEKMEKRVRDHCAMNVSSFISALEPPLGKLKPAPMEPLRVKEIYQPVGVREVETGVWQYDLGKNFSGWARIFLKTDGSRAGQKVVLKTAEKLDENGRIDQSVTGKDYAWTYVINDKKEQEFAPDFTYTGFRYVEMTGAVPEKEITLQGEFIYPDIDQAGDFSCSNTLFNQIHEIVLQAIKSNTKSYFTDCPHREKLGWLEQTHLIGPSIMYNLDVHNLYAKIEGDMADSQRENGLIPDICPEYVTGFDKWHKGFLDSPEWGSACVLAPWYAYKRYGDLALLEKYFPVMKKYVEYLSSKTHHEVLHHGLGDWLDIGPCTPHSQNTPVPVVATCIYYYDLQIMAEIARLLGKKEDAEEYQKKMKLVFEEYNLQFLDDQTGRYANGSQAAQAMSLIVGLVPEEYQEYVAEQLKACNSKTSDFNNDVISVLWTLFDRQNVDDFYLEFDATPERGIYATLVNKITNERMSIKPDQAVLLAMAADMEMYTTEMVMKELSTPFNKENVTSTACSVPLLALPDQMLEKALDCAINEEDYEAASAIRDEIERRKAKKGE